MGDQDPGPTAARTDDASVDASVHAVTAAPGSDPATAEAARSAPATVAPSLHDDEPHEGEGLNARLNWLRAGVLGANDGIISTAGLVVGVAAATTDRSAILIAGVASLVAGAVSMALGEYVSVSSARDTERALIAKERRELAEDPDGELAELAELYRRKGLTRETATQVARELTEHDALGAHLDIELGIDPDDLQNPWHAALASGVAFTLGAVLPLLAMVYATAALRVPVTMGAVVVALVVTGSVSARLGGARRRRAVVRLVVGGALAMAITFGIGYLFGGVVG